MSENLNLKLEGIVRFLNMNFSFYDLEKKEERLRNVYKISNNLIYFYPFNDGFATCPFKFYKDDMLVIDNYGEFKQISNLDDILLQMVRLFDFALDHSIILDPFGFMLELTDEICEGYQGRARLVVTNAAIRNHELLSTEFYSVRNLLINRFLDRFIRWNFGKSVNRCEDLKRELLDLNEKVIDMGIREDDSKGIEISCGGFDDDAIEYFILPVIKESNISMTLKGGESN